ncbi:MAG: TRAP transporter TAXI family solute receptor [Alphaproteobacteria bacterium]|jgi:TRAP transporter TAXI family solute receptor
MGNRPSDTMFRLNFRFMVPFRAFVLAFAMLAGLYPGFVPVHAQDIRFFRIGTGSISGVYFPVGGLIASAISNPPGSRDCDAGGSCGVPGLIAVAQATLGSIANVKAIHAGRLESALVQADIAHAAHAGTGRFIGAEQVKGLRAIANLYPEAVHIVVRRNSAIKSVRDLVGRRVSLDLAGSGTRAIARLVLKGYGVDLASLKQVNSQIGPAADRIRLKNIDAFFFVGGFPAGALIRLARTTRVRLLPIDGAEAAAIRKADPFLLLAHIPKNTYRGMAAVKTIAVGALWVVSDKVDAGTVYGLTRALWHPSTRRLLDGGVPAARQIQPAHALDGLALPLHPGAERYYREQKMLKGLGKKAPSAP